GAIAADSNANEAGSAALALSLPNRVENTHPDSFEIPVNAFALYLSRQAVLRAHVFAAAALKNQPHMNVRIASLFPMENGTAGAQIIAGVFTVNAVHRVLAQISARRGFFDSIAAKLFKLELIDASGCFAIKIDR